jgi:Na+/H+ antiporter
MTGAVEIFVGLLVAVAMLALVARKIHIPYPIVFVIAGLVIGLVPGLPRIRLNPDLVFVFFLPPLLYPAALFTSWRDFQANLRPIMLLAVGLVLFTTCIVAWLAHEFMGMSLAAGFVLGAIVSPPDAIAATAIAERLKIPRRIVTILEGESLVNDATALVAYRFAVVAVVTSKFSLTQATGQFLAVALGGILLGLFVGWLGAQFHKRVEDAPIEITISLLTPFAAYLAAERLHVSGVLAVVTAGLYLGRRAPELLNFNTRLRGGPVWEMVEFLMNGCVFILIGLQLPEVLAALSDDPIPVRRLIWFAVIISLAVIVIRLLWVFPAAYLPHLLFPRACRHDPLPNWRNVFLVAWTGMRGVVSLAAAMALPLLVLERDLILFLTFIVIIVTLVLQGLTLPLLIRWLGVEDDGSMEREEHKARLKANQTALAKLKEITSSNAAEKDAHDRLLVEYEDHILQLQSAGGATHNARLRRFSAAYERLSHEALLVERRTILGLRDDNVISDEVLRRIQRDIDLAEARLREHQ